MELLHKQRKPVFWPARDNLLNTSVYIYAVAERENPSGPKGFLQGLNQWVRYLMCDARTLSVTVSQITFSIVISNRFANVQLAQWQQHGVAINGQGL